MVQRVIHALYTLVIVSLHMQLQRI